MVNLDQMEVICSIVNFFYSCFNDWILDTRAATYTFLLAFLWFNVSGYSLGFNLHYFYTIFFNAPIYLWIFLALKFLFYYLVVGLVFTFLVGTLLFLILFAVFASLEFFQFIDERTFYYYVDTVGDSPNARRILK